MNKFTHSILFLLRPHDCERHQTYFKISYHRRNLKVCPILRGEELVRLLNFQHNLITKVENLNHLQRLIFLDLYDNKIESMVGVSQLTSLRVLMLGKNKLVHFFTIFQKSNVFFKYYVLLSFKNFILPYFARNVTYSTKYL